MDRVLSGLIIAAVALATAVSALAQDQAAPNRRMFRRDRNISVAERPRPGYDPIPIHDGGFDVLPQLTVGADYDDNIYAAPTLKTGDTILSATPEVDLTSTWSRNALQAYVRAPTRYYTAHTAENTADYAVGGAGRLDAGEAQFAGGGDTGEYTEARTAVGIVPGSAKPIRYQMTDGYLAAVQEFNRMRLSGRFDVSNFDYQNGQSQAGGLVFEHYRNRTDYAYTGKVEYAVSPDTSFYIDAAYNDHVYRLQPPAVRIDENSHGEQVNFGASFDLTRLIRGDVKIGYLDQHFATAAVSPVSGLSALAKVEWFPTQLTTVTLAGSRQIQDAAVSGAPVYVAGAASLNIDHELLRNLILSGSAGYEDDMFRGAARDDHRTSAYIGAKYYFNRVAGFTLGYTYLDQTSGGAGRGAGYRVNRISASTTIKF